MVVSRKLDSCKVVAEEVALKTGQRTLWIQVNVGDWNDCECPYSTVSGGSA